MDDQIEKKCGTCDWAFKSRGRYQCRKNAPVPPGEAANSKLGRFPEVKIEDWCSNYSAAEVQRENRRCGNCRHADSSGPPWYLKEWRFFANWCAANGLNSLPASVETFERFLNEGDYTSKYLAELAINIVHLADNHNPPGKTFFEIPNDGTGDTICRLNAPLVGHKAFPQVSLNDWCGQFAAAVRPHRTE